MIRRQTEAGIEAGDLIIQIDNKPLRELTPEEAANMMRGEPGTEVTVTIAREGMEPFELTVVREVIAIASVRSRLLEPDMPIPDCPVPAQHRRRAGRRAARIV